MRIIKLDATDSTNRYLRDLMITENLPDFTVVVTHKQTMGRGQMNSIWESEAGNNLTFSVLKKHTGLDVKHQFMISICVSLAIYNVLTVLKLLRVKVKWPNDILSGSSKICGILIENTISGSEVRASVIGIGLNVNQTIFSNSLNATSLKLELKKEQNLEHILNEILKQLDYFLSKLSIEKEEFLYDQYEKVLFRKDMPSTFQKPDGSLFTGIITGITKQGMLNVQMEDDTFTEFGMKELTLRY